MRNALFSVGLIGKTLIGLFAGLAVLGVVPAPAQTTFATITGIVTDPNGAVMPNVVITARHTAKQLPLHNQ